MVKYFKVIGFVHVKFHKVVGYNLFVSFVKYSNFTLNILGSINSSDFLTLSKNIWNAKKNIMNVSNPSRLCSKSFYFSIKCFS